MIKDSSEITKPMSIKTNVESKRISQKQVKREKLYSMKQS